MIQQMGRGYMTASEAVAVFRHGLNDELGVAAAARYDAQSGVDHRTSRIFAATYRIAARLAPGADDLPVALLEEHTPDFSEQDRRAVVLMLKSCAPHRVSGKIAHDVLRNLGAPLGDRVVGDAGVQLLLGRAEAQARMALSDHPEVAACGDPVSALLDDTLVTRIRTATSPPARGDVSDNTTPFLMVEASETKQLVVDDIMGHAREGTGPRKYSKAWFMKGGAAILARRLEVMVAALSVVTDHLQPAPVRLLAVLERSRTGSAVGCASRKKS